jgi:signal transduction histidine kinase
MEIKESILKKRRDFNTMLSLSGVIPFLVFVYLLAVKISSLEIFIGEIGYIMFITMVIFLLGIIVGRKMLISMIQEQVEKNRLAAITETILTLSHEINNPLLTIKGNLELLEHEFAQSHAWEGIRNRLATIKIHCERIREVTDKMSNLT